MSDSDNQTLQDKPQSPTPAQLVTPAVAPQQQSLHFQQINLTNIQPGAFLPASEMRAMQEIDPSWPERIMRMTELTMEHNRQIQNEQLAQSRLVIESQTQANQLNAEAQKRFMDRQRRTEWMAFFIIMASLATGIWVCVYFKDSTFLKVFFGGLATIIAAAWAIHKLHPSKGP